MARERERRVTRQELIAELDKIYRRMKEADPKKCSQEAWAKSVFHETYYRTATNLPALRAWWWNVLQEHPLESVEYGARGRNKDGPPQIQVTTTLHDGIRFSKPFVFTYLAQQQRWQVQWGLDTHLDPQWKGLPQAGKGTSR